MRARFPVSLAPVLAAVALLQGPPIAVQAQSVSLALGTPAPAVTLEDLEGNDVELLDLVEGKPALIEFWATWCEQCEALQPEMDRVQAMYGDDVHVIAVAVAVAQTVRRVQRHVDSAGHDYPFLYDARGAAVRAFRAPTTAVIVILDAEGKVAYTGVGADQDLVGAVERVLGR